MTTRTAWFNGKFMPESEVVISFRDRSCKYGDGSFDMTRTFDGKPFRLKEHIDRFYRSLAYLRIDPGDGAQEMIAVTEEVVERNEQLARGGRRLVGPARHPRRRRGRRRGWANRPRVIVDARRCRSRRARASSATASTSSCRRTRRVRPTCSARAPRRTTT